MPGKIPGLPATNDYPLIRWLVFLFPIFTVNISHWASTISGLLALVAIYYLLGRRKSLDLTLNREEKNLLWILLFFFISFLISAHLSDWGKPASRSLGTEIRFLLIIPFYLIARNIDGIEKYLLSGSVIAALVGGVQGIVDVLFLDKPQSWGVYGRLFIGPITMLMMAMLIPAYRVLKLPKKTTGLLAIIFVVGTITVILSTARSAYLVLLLLGILATVYYVPGKRKIAILLIGSLVVIGGYFGSSFVKDRVDLVSAEVGCYLNSVKMFPGEPEKYAMGSVGLRLEMWRATRYFLQDSPWFGVGRYNYRNKIKEYAQAGLVNTEAASHGHPHNAFVSTLDEKGLFGLVIVILLYFYPFYVFIRSRKASPDSAFAGIMLMTAMLVFSLTESAPVIKGNFISVFMVYLAVIFAWNSREVRKNGEKI